MLLLIKMSYELFNVEQGSPEWLELRKNKLTASTAASWLNCDPFMTPHKIGVIPESITHVDIIINGSRLEEPIRKFFSNYIGAPIKEVGFGVSTEFPIFGASPDGIIDDDTFIEIKTSQHPYKSVPLKHYLQILVTGGVFGFKVCYYIHFHTKTKCITIVKLFLNSKIWRYAIVPRGTKYYNDQIAKQHQYNVVLNFPYEANRWRLIDNTITY